MNSQETLISKRSLAVLIFLLAAAVCAGCGPRGSDHRCDNTLVSDYHGVDTSYIIDGTSCGAGLEVGTIDINVNRQDCDADVTLETIGTVTGVLERDTIDVSGQIRSRSDVYTRVRRGSRIHFESGSEVTGTLSLERTDGPSASCTVEMELLDDEDDSGEPRREPRGEPRPEAQTCGASCVANGNMNCAQVVNCVSCCPEGCQESCIDRCSTNTNDASGSKAARFITCINDYCAHASSQSEFDDCIGRYCAAEGNACLND